MKDTQTLDKLYLEWSQFTHAITEREMAYRDAIRKALDHLRYATPKTQNGPCIQAIGVLQDALKTPEHD